jgi:hypothetical protein
MVRKGTCRQKGWYGKGGREPVDRRDGMVRQGTCRQKGCLHLCIMNNRVAEAVETGAALRSGSGFGSTKVVKLVVAPDPAPHITGVVFRVKTASTAILLDCTLYSIVSYYGEIVPISATAGK